MSGIKNELSSLCVDAKILASCLLAFQDCKGSNENGKKCLICYMNCLQFRSQILVLVGHARLPAAININTETPALLLKKYIQFFRLLKDSAAFSSVTD